MKQVQRIFVDDGSPEASEFDNNFIAYCPDEPGSYERALKEARSRLSTTGNAGFVAEAFFVRRSVRTIPIKNRRFRDSDLRRRGASTLWNRAANAVMRFFRSLKRPGGDSGRRSRRSGCMTMGGSIHTSNRRLITS